MKKNFKILLCLILIIMLVACNQENNGKEELNGAVDGQKMFSYNSGKYIGKRWVITARLKSK